MSRTPIIAGNWKMHNTIAEASALVNALKQAGNKNKVEIILAPSYTALAVAAHAAEDSEIKIALLGHVYKTMFIWIFFERISFR